MVNPQDVVARRHPRVAAARSSSDECVELGGDVERFFESPSLALCDRGDLGRDPWRLLREDRLLCTTKQPLQAQAESFGDGEVLEAACAALSGFDLGDETLRHAGRVCELFLCQLQLGSSAPDARADFPQGFGTFRSVHRDSVPKKRVETPGLTAVYLEVLDSGSIVNSSPVA